MKIVARRIDHQPDGAGIGLDFDLDAVEVSQMGMVVEVGDQLLDDDRQFRRILLADGGRTGEIARCRDCVADRIRSVDREALTHPI